MQWEKAVCAVPTPYTQSSWWECIAFGGGGGGGTPMHGRTVGGKEREGGAENEEEKMRDEREGEREREKGNVMIIV